MAKFLVLANHELTEKQKADAVRSLDAEDFIHPPRDVKSLWSKIDPYLQKLKIFLEPVFDWIDQHGHEGDYLLVQGEFGAVYLVVNHALERKLVPVHATTGRMVRERMREDGAVETVHIFRHIRFRKYGE